MQGRTISIFFAAASIVMMALFTGYDLAGYGQAAEASTETPPPALTQPTQTAPPETVEPEITEPEITEPEISEPDALELLREQCAQAAQSMGAAHIFVYDPSDHTMLYSKTGPEDKLYPASITKLYTAYLALQYLPPDAVITAGDELSLVQPGSSTAYIARGHRLRVDMLIEAMLLPSGNDAAYILAAAAGRVIAGDEKMDAREAVAVFVWEMNQEAFRLGLTNSNFVNPDGYHDEYHFSCPQDVAFFSALAMAEPVIAKYASLCADAVTFESGEIITWYNTNRLVNPKSDSYCPFATGAKTGFTTEAGYCLLAAFREDGKELIVGIFGSERPYDRYDDAVALWEICQ